MLQGTPLIPKHGKAKANRAMTIRANNDFMVSPEKLG